NSDHSFILSDVRVRPTRVIKGDRGADDITFTVMGGSVGDITTLIIGNPELVPGSEYVLFLNPQEVLGAGRRLVLSDLMQGAFGGTRGRAISQATRFALLPDVVGGTTPPGGDRGLAVDEMVEQIRQIVRGR